MPLTMLSDWASNKKYTGNKIAFDASVFSASVDVSELLSRYPQGENTTAYINPENHSESVIEKGITDRMWFRFAFVFGFTFVLIVLLLAYSFGIIGLIKKSMKNRRNKNSFKNIFLSIFLIISLGMLFAIINLVYLAHTSDNWHKANATVICSMLGTKSDDETTTYCPQIIYEYVINNNKYTNHNINYSVSGWPDSDKAREFLKRYPKGENITIYYNPEKHSQSVIEPGITSVLWLIFGCGIVWVLLVVYLLRSE